MSTQHGFRSKWTVARRRIAGLGQACGFSVLPADMQPRAKSVVVNSIASIGPAFASAPIFGFIDLISHPAFTRIGQFRLCQIFKEP